MPGQPVGAIWHVMTCLPSCGLPTGQECGGVGEVATLIDIGPLWSAAITL